MAEGYGAFVAQNPTYKSFTVKLETLTPQEAQDSKNVLSFIENYFPRAPQKTIEQILKEPYKKLDILGDPARYGRYVDAIFNTSESDGVYKEGEENRDPTPAELAEFKRITAGTADRFKSIPRIWADHNKK